MNAVNENLTKKKSNKWKWIIGIILGLLILSIIFPNKKTNEEVVKMEQLESPENGDEEVLKSVYASFSQSIVKEAIFSNGLLNIQIKQNPGMENYFETGDKINKIKSTELVRIFSKNPNIEIIGLYFYDTNDNVSTGLISRKDLNNYLGLDIANMDWKTDFSNKYDNKEERQKFVNKFYK